MTSWPDEWLIAHRKISDYLSNIAQPDVLATALRDHVKTARHRRIEGRFGLRVVAEGPPVAPPSIKPRFRGVWLKSTEERSARFVTASLFDDRGMP